MGKTPRSRLFHKTCDLYATLREDGLEPDTIMYGSLIKAAVECGRLDLSEHFAVLTYGLLSTSAPV